MTFTWRRTSSFNSYDSLDPRFWAVAGLLHKPSLADTNQSESSDNDMLPLTLADKSRLIFCNHILRRSPAVFSYYCLTIIEQNGPTVIPTTKGTTICKLRPNKAAPAVLVHQHLVPTEWRYSAAHIAHIASIEYWCGCFIALGFFWVSGRVVLIFVLPG